MMKQASMPPPQQQDVVAGPPPQPPAMDADELLNFDDAAYRDFLAQKPWEQELLLLSI